MKSPKNIFQSHITHMTKGIERLLLSLALLVGFTQQANADKTFYFKVHVTANPTDGSMGKIFATERDVEENNKYVAAYDTTYSVTVDDDDAELATKTLRIWAKPVDESHFAAGINVNDFSDFRFRSNSEYNEERTTSTSTDPNDPTEVNIVVLFGKYKSFYYRIITTTDGGGKVNSGRDNDEGPDITSYSTYKVRDYEVLGTEPDAESVTTTFKLYDEPDKGYYLTGWTDDKGNTHPATGINFANVESSSQDPNNPAVFTYKANFKAYNKYYYQISAHTSDAKKGQVSVSDQSYSEPNSYSNDYVFQDNAFTTGSSTTKEFYLYAKPAEGYYIDYWTNDATGEKVDRKMAICYATGGLTSSNSSQDAPATASYTAHFGQYVVFLGKEYAQYGDISISKTLNQIGDKVTLTATPYADGLVQAKFIHWLGPDGNVASESPSYSFTITDANKGKYIAVFEGIDMHKGGYYALVNHGYSDEKSFRQLGLLGISQTRIGYDAVHDVPRYPAFALMCVPDDNERMHASPAFVIKVSGQSEGQDGGLYNADMMAQDIYVSVVAAGIGTVGIKNPHLSYKGTPYYYITGDVGQLGGYVVNWGDTRINCEVGGPGSDFVPGLYNGTEQSLTDHPYWWDILPYTEDDDTRAYFGAMPSDSSKIGDYYYTTMYTAFPYRCLDGVKAYTVDQIKSDGTLHLNRIANDIVPAKTPVILECKTTHPKTNRLLPLNEDVAPLKGTNYLRGEMWILEDENQPQDSYRTRFDPQTMRVMSYDGSDFRDINNYGYYIKEYMKNASGTTDNPHVAVGTTGIMPYIENNTCWLDVSSIKNPLERYTFNKAKLTIDGEDINAKNWETSIENHAGPADVTLTRDMSEADQWYTICLPFDLTDSKLKDAFGEGYDLEDFSSSTLDGSGNVSIQFKKVKNLEAGKPYLVKITKGFTKHTFWGVNMQEAPTEFADLSTAGHQMKGTENYETEDIEKYGNRSRFFYHLELITPEAGKGQIRPTRCFFLYPDNTAAAKSVTISTDDGGTTTSISKVNINNIDPTDHARIYNLQGQYMGTDISRLPAGVYIQNGRKFVK